jgi:methylmalonyl-CoA decarboxylase subunit alpha
VIDPRQTRIILAQSLAMLRGKQVPQAYRKHGNPPM